MVFDYLYLKNLSKICEFPKENSNEDVPIANDYLKLPSSLEEQVTKIGIFDSFQVKLINEELK